jgi:NAD(P)-dependent dehydrogenase (short-subunit alcohol dehydrogenase family)
MVTEAHYDATKRMHDMNRLNGKTAVITGGATGIGRAAAKRFIEEGAFVFIFGRRQEALDAAVADLGPNARAVKGSVSDLADLDRLYAAVKSERGTLDIVFANAGAGSPLPLGKLTAEHIDETFDTNVKGTIFTVQKALPLMGQGGSIILTGSSAGTTGAPTMSVYSASKAAVRNLARTWAEDLKGTGIRVNVLSPGPTATELAKAALGEEGMKLYASMNRRISTYPSVPCTRIRCPSRISWVACSTPTTAGKPYSRAITAPWVIRPPTSVTRPLIATNRGVQLGSV